MDSRDEIEIGVFADLARTRLLESGYSPGQRLEALLAGRQLDRVPFQLFGYSSKLVNRSVYEFFLDPVVRFKTTCAQIIRWGAVELQNATRINSYKVGEALGAELKYSEDAAPSTATYVLKDGRELERLEIPDLDPYMAADLWSIENIRRRFGNMIGPPTTFIYPPFSWVATYLLDVNQLLICLYDNPALVHRLCEFATELEIAVSRRLARGGECGFFMPDGFCELLSPEQYREFAVPYTARLINANKDCLFYTAVPKADFRQVTDLYEAVADHGKLICMGSSLNPANPLVSMSDLRELCGIFGALGRPLQIAIHQNMVKEASEEELATHIGQMIDAARECRFMIRTDVIDPQTPPQKVDALVRAVEKSSAPPGQPTSSS
ncbi:MAG: hypothetical protein JW820_00385 [Spirochaetales bacterium]|nr:hypothetical protein [Spirochaetales bacterium]